MWYCGICGTIENPCTHLQEQLPPGDYDRKPTVSALDTASMPFEVRAGKKHFSDLSDYLDRHGRQDIEMLHMKSYIDYLHNTIKKLEAK